MEESGGGQIHEMLSLDGETSVGCNWQKRSVAVSLIGIPGVSCTACRKRCISREEMTTTARPILTRLCRACARAGGTAGVLVIHERVGIRMYNDACQDSAISKSVGGGEIEREQER